MNKIQKIIIGIGILALVFVWVSHFYEFHPANWLKGQEKCIEGENVFNERLNALKCEPPFITEKYIPFRERMIGETFFSFLTVGTILIFLLLLTKNVSVNKKTT